eukprot:CAMPEP_0195008638 /NCGR_PEP_ID=MMETSP0326_2-20130528/8622_1 /TAXON_ID=2866 ORGANISM="Crypthecodinium cohnii, Strain Seligo" /NCGR_SAMPLE_ID=MMETSP0326_2 /ASSEMBLY_ACC=CAM_ASM_000348 /LENGTH=159 /DNA_ID=CAMNT_0040016515 /DNA_START=545 /DNA_END=1022 /DNA_ORIENTATION=-
MTTAMAMAMATTLRGKKDEKEGGGWLRGERRTQSSLGGSAAGASKWANKEASARGSLALLTVRTWAHSSEAPPPPLLNSTSKHNNLLSLGRTSTSAETTKKKKKKKKKKDKEERQNCTFLEDSDKHLRPLPDSHSRGSRVTHEWSKNGDDDDDDDDDDD